MFSMPIIIPNYSHILTFEHSNNCQLFSIMIVYLPMDFSGRQCGLRAPEIPGYDFGPSVGQGGMSVVFRATRQTDGQTVAIKIFTAGTGPNGLLLAHKFVQEARLLAMIDHPHLVKFYEAGTLPDGRPWLAMEYIGKKDEGNSSLAARLNTSKPFTPGEIVRLYEQIRAALAHCHAKGIVHGDVKAENILLDESGDVKLTDLGIARVLNPELHAEIGLSTLTTTGTLGTPYVLAPECRDGTKPTPAADVYAFGVLLYRLVTGIWYDGSERLRAQTRRFAPTWAPLLKKMLSPEVSRRPVTAAKLPKRPRTCALWAYCPRRLFFTLCALVFIVGGTVATIEGRKWHVRRTVEGKCRAFLNRRYPNQPFDLVYEATLTRRNRLHLKRPIFFCNLHLPDKDGVVEIAPPPGYLGPLLIALNVDGDLFDQMHVQRDGTFRVFVSKHAITLKPMAGDPDRPPRQPLPPDLRD